MNRLLTRYVAAASIALLSLAAVAAPPARAGTWETGVLDSDGNPGAFCELVVDGAGDLHVVYLRGDLGQAMLLSRIGRIWQTPDTVVAGGASGRCALAMTSSGEKKVAYYRSDLGALGYAGPELVDSWTLGTVAASAYDIGTFLSLQRRSSGEMSLSCRNATAQSLLLLTRDEWGAWSAPQTLDPGPGRGAHSDHAYRAGAGYAFSEYDAALGSLLFADTSLSADEWTIGPVVSSGDDVGQGLSLKELGAGAISLSFRNATAGSLLLMTRDGAGAWTAPVTLDPGPSRGTQSDHVYRSGAGFAFSEYDAGQGSLLFADPVLHADVWTIGTVYVTPASGAFPSAVIAPDGRVASAFYHYETATMGRPYVSGLYPSGYAAVKAIDDTIGNSSSAAVYIDLALTPEWNWHLSYRNALDNHLWYARTDTFVITAVDNEETPGAPPSALRLHQNYPNPFNPATVIEYAVPAPGVVSLCIYDAAGRLVRTLVNGERAAGVYRTGWNGRNEANTRVASGVYFLHLSQGDASETRKILVLR